MGATFLDTSGVARMTVIDLLLALAAGESHLLGIDDDDIVTAIEMRREQGLVLAAQAIGDNGGKAPDDQAVGIDQDPFLVDFRGFCGIGFHGNDLISRCRQCPSWKRRQGEVCGLLADHRGLVNISDEKMHSTA